MTKEADCGGWRVGHRYAQTHSVMWLLFEQGCVQAAAGAPFAVSALAVAVALPAGRTLRCRMCARIGAYGCRGLARGRAPADSGRFCRKRAPISPWVLDFWAVPSGSCSLSASPTWGNADAGWRFGPIRPAKSPRSCRRGLLGLKVAHEDVQLRRGRGDAERIGAFAECGDRNTSIG